MSNVGEKKTDALEENPKFVHLLKKYMVVSLSLQNIIKLVVDAMQAAETLDGINKKNWVMEVVTRLINDNDLVDVDTHRELLSFVRETLPSVIDTIAAAAKQVYDINKKVRRGCLLFANVCNKK